MCWLTGLLAQTAAALIGATDWYALLLMSAAKRRCAVASWRWLNWSLPRVDVAIRRANGERIEERYPTAGR